MTHTEIDGQTIAGRYQVHEKIGEGGMGSVYRGYDAQLQREVALKVLRKEWVDRPEVLRRLDRECLHMAKMGAHSNIVTLFDRLEHEGSVILVIEFVPGEPLDTIIKRTAEKQSAQSVAATAPFDAGVQAITLTRDDIVSIASQCLVGLAHAHGCGIIHRDIKPSNILVMRNHSGELQAKILDFGIGKAVQGAEEGADSTALTRADGPGPGSPPYMAPEQIASSQFGEIGPQTDLYAMGVTLYEMLTLQLPFEGKSVTEFLHAHTSMEPRNPRDLGVELPPQLAKVVQRALRKSLDERYQSAEEFRADLDAIKHSSSISGGTMVTPLPDFTPMAAAPAEKKGAPMAALGGIAAVVAVLVIAGISYMVIASEGGVSSEEQDTASVTATPPSPEPAPIDDGPVSPEKPSGPSPERAEAAKRQADTARAEADDAFGDARDPDDNSNYQLGMDSYADGENLMASGQYHLAAERFKGAKAFFDGARPAPERVAVDDGPVSDPEPEPAPRPAPPQPGQEEPSPRPAQARQEAAPEPAPSPNDNLSGQSRQQTYEVEHDPNDQGLRLRVLRAWVDPPNTPAGQNTELSFEYAVHGAGQQVTVTERILIMTHSDVELAEVYTEDVRRHDGTYRKVLNIEFPEDVPAGTYRLTCIVEAQGVTSRDHTNIQVTSATAAAEPGATRGEIKMAIVSTR